MSKPTPVSAARDNSETVDSHEELYNLLASRDKIKILAYISRVLTQMGKEDYLYLFDPLIEMSVRSVHNNMSPLGTFIRITNGTITITVSDYIKKFDECMKLNNFCDAELYLTMISEIVDHGDSDEPDDRVRAELEEMKSRLSIASGNHKTLINTPIPEFKSTNN